MTLLNNGVLGTGDSVYCGFSLKYVFENVFYHRRFKFSKSYGLNDVQLFASQFQQAAIFSTMCSTLYIVIY